MFRPPLHLIWAARAVATELPLGPLAEAASFTQQPSERVRRIFPRRRKTQITGSVVYPDSAYSNAPVDTELLEISTGSAKPNTRRNRTSHGGLRVAFSSSCPWSSRRKRRSLMPHVPQRDQLSASAPIGDQRPSLNGSPGLRHP